MKKSAYSELSRSRLKMVYAVAAALDLHRASSHCVKSCTLGYEFSSFCVIFGL